MSKKCECMKSTCQKMKGKDCLMGIRTSWFDDLDVTVNVNKKQIIFGAIFCLLLGFFVASLIPRKLKFGPMTCNVLSNNGNHSGNGSANDNGRNSGNENGNNNGNNDVERINERKEAPEEDSAE